jgi:hypothetical protein
VQRDDIGHPLGEISVPENRVGPKTYSKGRPDLIARHQVHVSGVWQLLWLLAIQLMTLPSPVAHQYANHREILDDRRLLLGTWNEQKECYQHTASRQWHHFLYFFF